MRLHAACCLAGLTLVPSLAGACPLPDADGECPTPGKPVDGRITTGFGLRPHPILVVIKMHTGTDFAAPTGTPVYAAAAGEVVSAGRAGEYGNRVLIRHGGSVMTAYGHLQRIDVAAGDCIARGTVIGSVGSTGLAAGPTLHLEVVYKNVFIDPLAILGATEVGK